MCVGSIRDYIRDFLEYTQLCSSNKPGNRNKPIKSNRTVNILFCLCSNENVQFIFYKCLNWTKPNRLHHDFFLCDVNTRHFSLFRKIKLYFESQCIFLGDVWSLGLQSRYTYLTFQKFKNTTIGNFWLIDVRWGFCEKSHGTLIGEYIFINLLNTYSVSL